MGTSSIGNDSVNQSEIRLNGSAQKVINTDDNQFQLLATKHGWGSAWWEKSIDLSKDWSSSFYVTAFNGSGTSDGFTFAINGDPVGLQALGDGGQNLGFFGYDTKLGVKNSYAVLFDMWTSSSASLIGFAGSNITTIPQATFSSPVQLANNAYEVNISYSSTRKALSVTIGGKTFEQNIDLQATVGKNAYLGFTAANGGGTLDTDINHWRVNASEQTSNQAVRGNSIYTIVDGPSWAQAEANSVKLGGHLVTVNDKSEEELLYNEFGKRLPTYASSSSPAGALWIGLTDKSVEGSYQWASGQVSKWFENEYKGKGGWIQNSDSSQQDYLVLRRNGDNASGYDWDDYWESNATWSGTSVTAGIAETSFIRRGDSAYVIVQGPTWEEAEANAVKLGGHLVTINDTGENNWVYTTFAQGIAGGIWLGGTDKEQEGTWKWADGSAWIYSNFSPGQPDNHQVFNPAGGEDYLQFNSAHGAQWNDISNGYLDNPFKAITGIAEIKLAPNNAPTGTPTLSGTTKVGQVLTIDKTPVQDADNFTGYTPDFNYSWETSTDGITWTKLTSADATDNNNSYTLTSSELSKQVRGVVSYLDGYGTNEVVASAASASVAPLVSIAGISVNALSGNATTTEQGGTSVYSFVLNKAPTSNVTLTFSLSDGTEGQPSATTLVFTSANWNIAQTLSIVGLDDFDNDGDIAYTLTTRVSSSDISYGQRRDGTGGVSVANITLVNKDDGLDRDQTIYGDNGGKEVIDDILNGANGKDRLYGMGGRDQLFGGRNDDRLYGGYDDDILSGDDGNDDLYGEQDDDTLIGGKGDDRLVGSEGYDLLIGGEGNDTYVIDDEFDTIDDQGLATDVDRVIIRGNFVSYALSRGIENASLDSTSSVSDVTGNDLNNGLSGNDGTNTIDGGSGNDTLNGGGGNDDLIGGSGNDTLNGGDGNDELYAGDGNDTVDAGAGDDLVVGGDGKGDDTYDGGSGVDTVKYSSAVSSSISVNLATRLASGFEIGNDILRNIENVIGGAKNDTITGSSVDNVISGGGGADTMVGGLGNDTYVVDNPGDIVTENANAGSDTVQSGITYVLGANLENLSLIGTGAINGTGNTLNNVIKGNGGNNTIDGGAGMDVLTGLGGADSFLLRNKQTLGAATSDHITDFSNDDTIRISKSAFGISASAVTLKSVSGLTAVNAALSTNNLFVYDSSNGNLYWNQNGSTSGAGKGGILAVLDNKFGLGIANINLIA